MARTLVIGNADFSVNKLDTVSFGGVVPCTALSLDKSTASITSISGTSTIVASPTPANTTDSIIWASSNDDVATVAGGVVTAVGCGTAIISATCGTQSASCTVTVTHIATITYAINRYIGKGDNKDYLNGGDHTNSVIGFSATGSTRKISFEDRGSDRYPYIIPNGAASIVVTCTNFKVYGYWLVSTERGEISSSVAKALTKDAFGNIPSSAGSRTATIPEKTGDYADMDSIAFGFYFTNGTVSESDTDEITITFTA